MWVLDPCDDTAHWLKQKQKTDVRVTKGRKKPTLTRGDVTITIVIWDFPERCLCFCRNTLILWYKHKTHGPLITKPWPTLASKASSPTPSYSRRPPVSYSPAPRTLTFPISSFSVYWFSCTQSWRKAETQRTGMVRLQLDKLVTNEMNTWNQDPNQKRGHSPLPRSIPSRWSLSWSLRRATSVLTSKSNFYLLQKSNRTVCTLLTPISKACFHLYKFQFK